MDRKNAQDSSISCWPLFQQKGEGNSCGPSGQSGTVLPNRNLPILSFHSQTGKPPSAHCKPKNLIHRSDNLTKFFIWKKNREAEGKHKALLRPQTMFSCKKKNWHNQRTSRKKNFHKTVKMPQNQQNKKKWQKVMTWGSITTSMLPSVSVNPVTHRFTVRSSVLKTLWGSTWRAERCLKRWPPK